MHISLTLSSTEQVTTEANRGLRYIKISTFAMNLNIISYNVHGLPIISQLFLNEAAKVRKLRNYIRFTQPQCGIPLLQEHRLCGSKAQDLGRSLCPGADYHYLESDPGYRLNLEGVRKGGVCILISPFIKHMVSNVGSLRHNRAFWLFIQDSPIQKLGIGNIYA